MDSQKIDVEELLDNEVVVSESDDNNNKKSEHELTYKEDYVYIYSGKAMNERELLSFSARNELNMVMVAGAYESGKTTLIVMLYYLFREGKNKKVHFKSSNTMKGYWERGKSLLLNSGLSEPIIDRTPTEATDLFLNLNVLDEEKKQRNMIFADLSGEIFQTQDLTSDILDVFVDSKNVWLVLDGKKMSNVDTRRSTLHEFVVMIDNLIKYGYITQYTKVLLICTKMDVVKDKDSEQYIDKKIESVRKKFENSVAEIKLYKVSAIKLDDDKESEKLEQIIIDSFEERHSQQEYHDENKIELSRKFDYYGLRI